MIKPQIQINSALFYGLCLVVLALNWSSRNCYISVSSFKVIQIIVENKIWIRKNKETAEIYIGRIVFLLTLPLSRRFVIITITWTFCSQTILQKASHVSINGPWVPIYELLFWKPSMKLALM